MFPRTMLKNVRLFLLSLCLILRGLATWAQNPPETVSIHVQFDQVEGTLAPVWNFFGYDEPNYTYSANGKKLLGELASTSAAPVYIRVHNLLTSGDGSASLKWGSTGVYSEDTSGNPIYNWTIVDRIFDTFQSTGVKPLVEIGFMPEALSTHPKPYRHNFPNIPVTEIYTGWVYPPKDYAKWSELVFKFVDHLRQRYGDGEVKTWLWEVWNEPDIGYWQGTREEYFKLYDFSVASVLRALPEAKIGGPDTTGPGNAKAEEFLRAFLDHCSHGKNYATGKIGARLDFISFHPKGAPMWQIDHVQMGISQQLAAIQKGFEIVSAFPEWRNTPIILGESDPEGCAACSAKDNPQNLYRNGALYATYTVEVLNNVLALAQQQHINFFGSVTWAFEFEDQPYFAGFRELATNGIDKPVLNAFRMLGMLGSQHIKATSSEQLAPQDVLLHGVRQQPDINVIATRKDKDKNSDRQIEILLWNYHDVDLPAPDAHIDLMIDGLPANARVGTLEHLRVGADHSNAFTTWKKMGSPQSLSADDYRKLERSGNLELLNEPSRVAIRNNSLDLHFDLPRQALSLIRLTW